MNTSSEIKGSSSSSLLSKKDYWNKFYNAIQPNTIVKATAAAEKAKSLAKRDHTTLNGLILENDVLNTTNSPSLTNNSLKAKKIKPQQSGSEEFSPKKSIPAPTEKKPDVYSTRVCSLTTAARESQKCIHDLRQIHYDLIILSEKHQSEKKKSSRPSTQSISNGGSQFGAMEEMNKYLAQLSKDFFVLTHKLNETAIGFHIVEDFLRNPENLSILDFSFRGRIRIPAISSTNKTIAQFAELEKEALSIANFFKVKHPKEISILSVFNTFTKMLNHLQICAMHSKIVFDAILYISPRFGLEVFQEFIFQLNFVERSDVIMEMQILRRRIDEITIAFEKLSWKCHLVLHRAQGFPSVSTAERNSKMKVPAPLTKIENINEKQTFKAVANKKLKKNKTKRKTSVAEQFIFNQSKLNAEELDILTNTDNPSDQSLTNS